MSEQDPSSPSADSGQPEPASPPPGSAGYESGAPDSWAAPPPADWGYAASVPPPAAPAQAAEPGDPDGTAQQPPRAGNRVGPVAADPRTTQPSAPPSGARPPGTRTGPRATGTGRRGADPGWPTAGSAPGKQVSVAVERVGEVEGQRYVAVRAADGKLYRIGEDRLRWVWRLVFTSVGIGHSMGASATPVTLVIAEKAWALQVGTDREPRPLRVACARCGRADSAWLFRTLQRATDDVYFTRCRRCWRSQRLGSFRRHPQA